MALISARIDHEIQPDDRALLDLHLKECEECRATAEAFEVQDRELTETFEPRRQAAVGVAQRVNARLAGDGAISAGQHFRGARRAMPASLFRLAAGVAAVAAVLVPVIATWLLVARKPIAVDSNQLVQSNVGRDQPDRLLPRPLPHVVAPKPLEIGAVVRTGPGERRRATLPDGSVLYVNQNTTVRFDDDRQVRLDAGQVFVAVSPRAPDQSGATFTVQAPDKSFTALGTKFAVQADAKGSELLVSQGKVKVKQPGSEITVDHGNVFQTSDQKPPDGEDANAAVSPAERVTHVLDWTRDLMAATDVALVPASRYEGGALVAYDANGQEAKLSLRKYHVHVHIEDGFARTTIDQTYFNHHPWRLEGTFYFPLPPDASLSRLAMYVDGHLMEGGMAERQYARQVYDRIVSSQRDPALLEWVDGTTFKMRVFPLEGRQEKRIILSYSQRLPTLYGRTQYRFPAGHSLQVVNDWSFVARVKDGAKTRAESPTNPRMKQSVEGNDLLLSDAARGAKVDHDFELDLTAADGKAPTAVRFSRADHEGKSYLMLRYRPDLHTEAKPQRRDWIFLYETSADRDPLLARVQIEVIRALLDNAEHDDTFRILTAGTNTSSFADEAMTATPKHVAEAVDFLEQSHLIGALDLGNALDTAADIAMKCKNPYLVHVGSGITHMGVPQGDLLGHLPKAVPYVGVGVGKHYDRNFMKQAAERSGGYYTQINPDEPITWRAFDLLATLNTPRLLNVTVFDKKQDVAEDQRPRFLVDNPSISQGEEICAISRLLQAEGREGEARVPETLVVTGLLDGKPYREEVKVGEVAGHADYLPRTWAKLEIDRLLADNAGAHQQQIIELSKAMYVMTPLTSLLVLENEAMYKQFNVDRGRKDHWALYPCPETIPVVYEPDPTQAVDVRNAPRNAKPAANQVLRTIVVRNPPHWLDRGNDRSAGRPPVLSAVEVYAGAYGLPEDELATLGENGRGGMDRFRLKSRLAGAVEKKVRAADMENAKGWAWDSDQFGLGDLLASGIAPNETAPFEEFRELDGKRLGRREFLREQLSPEGFIYLSARRSKSEALVDSRRLIEDRKKEMVPELLPELLEEGRAGFEFASRRWVEGERLAISDGTTNYLQFGDRDGRALNHFLGYIAEPSGEAGEPAQLVAGLKKMRKTQEMKKAIFDRMDEVGEEVGGIVGAGRGRSSLLYERVSFSRDPRLFTDLPSYAPGLSTSGADIRAVLESEAMPELRDAPGHIDPAARRLIEQTRNGGWRKFQTSAGKDRPEGSFTFDAGGRFVAERTLALGLHETIVCDAETLLHVYPEIGLAASRRVTRFHRAAFFAQVPWLSPPAEDMAHGADLEMAAHDTVAIVPHAVKNQKSLDGKAPRYLRVQLVFRVDRLAERQLVVVPDNRVVAREVYDSEGGVRVLDEKGKELAKSEQRLAAANQPHLHPDTSSLVVLPLPVRSREHVMASFNLDPNRPLSDPQNGCYADLEPDRALQLLAALYAQGLADDARRVVRDCFLSQKDRRIGLLTVLLGAGVDVASDPLFRTTLAENAHKPIARYLALHGNRPYQAAQARVPVNLGTCVDKPDSFLGRLAEFDDLLLRDPYRVPLWVEPSVYRADLRRYSAFIERNKANALGWAMVAHVEDHRGARNSRLYGERWAWLAKQWEQVATALDSPAARFEQASCLLYAGKLDVARQIFADIYAQELKAGVLPAIDGRFRSALQAGGARQDQWTGLIRQTAAQFKEQNQRAAVIALATQCQQLDDRPLADNLMKMALSEVPPEDELSTTLLAIGYYRRLGDTARAEELIDGLVDREPFSSLPGLWRLAVTIADERGSTEKAVRCLERALDLEFADLPDVIDLQAWRNDYGRLLNHYHTVVNATVMQRQAPPGDIAARTVRAVDRWRKHDPEASGACQTASEILRQIGARGIAWEYLTTSVGREPTHAGTWTDVAQRLQRQGDFDMADRAYAVACRASPNDALILWDRAQNKRRAGDVAGCNKILRKIAETEWEPRFSHIRADARWELEQR
jgi:ferric-dicitrate binding protein FerR (iron transport regulator)